MASLTATKAQGEEESSEITFEMTVVIYTMAIMFIPWPYRGLWRKEYRGCGILQEEDPHDREVCHPRTWKDEDNEGQRRKEDEEEKEEEREPPTTPLVPRPKGLPQEIPLTPPTKTNNVPPLKTVKDLPIIMVGGKPFKVPDDWVQPIDWEEVSHEAMELSKK